MRIGFIGVGNMGFPMACNLLRGGHHLNVYDILTQRADLLKDEGATVVTTAASACKDADVVISMLPAAKQVLDLYIDKGLLDEIDSETIVVDCSTIGPEASRQVALEAGRNNIVMLDAPVSGGTAGASEGTLTFMVGGDSDALNKIKPILELMGKNIFLAGPSGSGQTAKLCNNMLLAAQMAATTEALALGVNNGLDARVLSQIMRRSSGSNWVLEVYNPWPGVMEDVPAARKYAGGFVVDLMIKDLDLALKAGAQTNFSPALGSVTRQIFSAHKKDNQAGQLDFSSVQLYTNASVQ